MRIPSLLRSVGIFLFGLFLGIHLSHRYSVLSVGALQVIRTDHWTGKSYWSAPAEHWTPVEEPFSDGNPVWTKIVDFLGIMWAWLCLIGFFFLWAFVLNWWGKRKKASNT